MRTAVQIFGKIFTSSWAQCAVQHPVLHNLCWSEVGAQVGHGTACFPLLLACSVVLLGPARARTPTGNRKAGGLQPHAWGSRRVCWDGVQAGNVAAAAMARLG